MKKSRVVVPVVAIAAAFTLGVCAQPAIEMISAELRPDLTIIIDGKNQTFQDANGKQVYPVMYEGTTYLPLRAIGGIMGKAVAWDGETQTVTIGEQDAYHSVVAMEDKGDGFAGSKVVAANELTFPYGDLKEDKTFESGIRLEGVNSATQTFSVKLDGAYSKMSVTFHNPEVSEAEVAFEIRDKDTGIVLASETLQPGTFLELKDFDLNGATNIEFAATGKAGGGETVYFLEPAVK